MGAPRVTHCLLCEGVRQELGRKTTILGFMGMSPDVRVRVTDFSIPTDLAFLLVGGGVSAPFRVEPRIIGPGGEIVVANPSTPTIPGGPDYPTLHLGMVFRGVKFPGPGVYRFQANFNDGEYTYETKFQLEQATPDQVREIQGTASGV